MARYPGDDGAELQGARVTVPQGVNYEVLAVAAGARPGTARFWNDGTAIVPGVTQEALEAALAQAMTAISQPVAST